MSAAKIARILERSATTSYGKVRVWCHKDELYDLNCVKSGRKSIMVWGCINGYNLNHLVRVPSCMNGEKYGNLVLDVIYPKVMVAEEAIFQEDNAPIHKSKPVKKFKDNLGIVTVEWPSQSPDLENPNTGVVFDSSGVLTKGGCWKNFGSIAINFAISRYSTRIDKLRMPYIIQLRHNFTS
ncbi:6474_t:CDS:2 [Ambispora gerdemannii]|uniref:6474_t:CDS:1 n=1 Tax=Ambispora gerdemannii TaxID=144530 RepID=A0A9N9G8E2_9GLOM|nr:6474_t:CDS:2 [Ambispora gerdemannii]